MSSFKYCSLRSRHENISSTSRILPGYSVSLEVSSRAALYHVIHDNTGMNFYEIKNNIAARATPRLGFQDKSESESRNRPLMTSQHPPGNCRKPQTCFRPGQEQLVMCEAKVIRVLNQASLDCS